MSLLMTTAAISRSAKGLTLLLSQIEIPSTARPYNATAVVELSRSIAAIGLQSAPTVIKREGRFILVAGRHRFEALRMIHVESVLVRLVDFDDVEARMWTISENLFRAELTISQRAEQVAEYAQLAAEKRDVQSGQVAQNESKREDGRGHRHEGGDSLAARDLGITREDVRRAKTIAALPEQTKQAARDAGLDDNQSALLKAARAPTAEAQIAVLAGIRDEVELPTTPRRRPSLRTMAVGPPRHRSRRRLLATSISHRRRAQSRYAISSGSAGASLPVGSRSRRQTIGRTSSAWSRWRRG